MTEAEALLLIRTYARRGWVRFKRHARDRMEERNVGEEDVERALIYAAKCGPDKENPDHWAVVGPDRESAALLVIVALEENVIVVTVWGK